jgi:trk system potassium uptake protein TrkA
MHAVIVGSGRVGSTLAKTLAAADWDVVVVDEDDAALELLGDDWRGGFVLGHGMDTTVLEEAGIARAEMVVAATDGDNTNIVVAQIAKRRYEVASVAARIHDPARAAFFAGRGFDIVSPVQSAIAALTGWALGTNAGD